MTGMRKILVPVDLSEFSARSIAYGSELAKLTGGSLTVLTVVHEVLPLFEFFPVDYTAGDFYPALKENAEKELRSLVAASGADTRAEIEVRRGYPAAEIVEFAAAGQFDLIIMATHGHSGLEHALLGSITEKVLRKAHCPVLVVR